MKLIDAAFEQLRWQREQDPQSRNSATGVTVVLGRKGNPEDPVDRTKPPDCVMLYAWGEDAVKLCEVLKAVGMDPGSPDARHFPTKPDLN